MVTPNTLKSFVATQERKFQAKVDAAATGRDLPIHQHPMTDGVSGSMHNHAYHVVLQHRFNSERGAKLDAGLHYEFTPY
ncbi:MAG TPA: hypothetical protein VMY99_00585 [Nevskiaceae bacterium]|nr:hypothetical protein [Nevskiaceae bacterium]